MSKLDTLPIGAKEVAKILGIDRRQILRMVKAGGIPVLGKLDGDTGAYLFDRSDIEAFGSEVAA